MNKAIGVKDLGIRKQNAFQDCANEYKDYILGFIFYKYLSDTEVKYVRNVLKGTNEDIKALSEADTGIVKTIQQNIGYFIAYENLFSTWL